MTEKEIILTGAFYNRVDWKVFDAVAEKENLGSTIY